MPLRIKLPSHEKIIINGAVLENSGDATTMIVHNRVDILRRKEVMADDEATTPARRVYYALQCAYMFDEERSRYITHALEYLKQYRDAAPSSVHIIAKIAEEIEEQRFYDALKATNDLITHEAERLEVATGSDQGISAPIMPSNAVEEPKEKPKKPKKKSKQSDADTPVVEVKKSRKTKGK